MNKLFGLFLLALACWSPDASQAANRFLTCTVTCTITAIDTTIWGSTSGGTGASVPGSGDAVILDSATCVGGVTCTATFGAGYNPTWQSIDQSGCTASTSGCILDANTNTNTITLTATNGYTNTGSGTRTVSGGTWIITASGGLWNVVASLTVTNAPNIQLNSTVSNQLVGGGKTYGAVSISSKTSGVTLTGSDTFGSLAISAPNVITLANGSNHTITTFTNTTAANSTPILFNRGGNSTTTITSANNWTCTWCGFNGITFAGGGTFTGMNSLDFGSNAGITINPPSGGGGGGGRIIGG